MKTTEQTTEQTMGRMMNDGKTIGWWAIVIGLVGGLADMLPAQQELSAEVKQAVAQITQQDVTAAVTFLASDEMAGRDTPSRELTIASAYVAARFRGAGLVGGGDDGSFYQRHELETVAMPSSGIEFLVGGRDTRQYGVIAADSEDFEYNGPVTRIARGQELSGVDVAGAVLVDASWIASPRDEFMFRRELSVLAGRGAKCLLLEVKADSPMVGTAQQSTEPRLINRRQGNSLPTLLVGKFDPQQEVTVKIPKRTVGQTEVRNVIGVLPGSDPKLKEEAVLFSAHLDHVGTQDGLEDPIFNGADDNATGVTTVIELARAFGSLQKAPRRTTIFMTFWGEEKGLLGSRHYASQPTWPLEKIVANINIEMVGRPEPGAAGKCWVTGWHESDLGPIMAKAAESVDVLIFEHPEFSPMLYRSSDNYAFAEKGVVAHSFSAGSLHDDYHQPGDEWEKLELRHMTKVIQGLFVGSLPIANGEATPRSKSSNGP
ncbi:MAG: M28 family peptidase [Planctomycetota bacterium]|nr:M28 family peptidase [Planctomycetota bacterium]